MNERNLVVLTIGGRALELQMANLPAVKEPVNYILFVDNRAEKCIKANELKALLKKHRVTKKGYKVHVHSAKEILEEAMLQLNPSYSKFMNEWVKSIHCLMYWYGACVLGLGKTLYIEDDVLLFEGFDAIFNEQKSMKYISMFNSGTIYQRKTFGNDLFFAVALSDIAIGSVEGEELLDTNINVGQIYFGEDVEEFKLKLEKMTRAIFDTSLAKSTFEFFVKKHEGKLPVSSFGNTFDERLLGIVFFCCGIKGGELNDKIQIIVQDFNKVKWEKVKQFIKKNIVHVVMSSPKDDWWDKLIERSEIKAEK